MSNDIKKTLGINIRSYRKAFNMSQEELSDATNLDRTLISQLERGQRNTTIDTVSKIAKGLSIDYIKLFQEPSVDLDLEVLYKEENLDEHLPNNDYTNQIYKTLFNKLTSSLITDIDLEFKYGDLDIIKKERPIQNISNEKLLTLIALYLNRMQNNRTK